MLQHVMHLAHWPTMLNLRLQYMTFYTSTIHQIHSNGLLLDLTQTFLV